MRAGETKLDGKDDLNILGMDFAIAVNMRKGIRSGDGGKTSQVQSRRGCVTQIEESLGKGV